MTGQELNLTRADTSMTPHEFGFYTSPFPLYPLMQLISTVSQQNQGIFSPSPSTLVQTSYRYHPSGINKIGKARK